jgi:hypothetical protein
MVVRSGIALMSITLRTESVRVRNWVVEVLILRRSAKYRCESELQDAIILRNRAITAYACVNVKRLLLALLPLLTFAVSSSDGTQIKWQLFMTHKNISLSLILSKPTESSSD